MITELTYDEVPRSVYKRFFVLSFPPGSSQDRFFKIDTDKSWILDNYETVWDYVAEPRSLPRGMYMVKALDMDGNYVLVACNKKEIDKAQIIDYLEQLFTPNSKR